MSKVYICTRCRKDWPYPLVGGQLCHPCHNWDVGPGQDIKNRKISRRNELKGKTTTDVRIEVIKDFIFIYAIVLLFIGFIHVSRW